MQSFQILLGKIRCRPTLWAAFVSLLGAVAVAAFYLPLPAAIRIHAYGGYYFCVAVSAAVLFYTVQVVRNEDWKGFACRRWKGLLLVLLASVSVHLHKPHMMRVFNDEPAHQMVAKVFHEERINAVPSVGYHLKGDLVYGERSLNPRMFLYPFFVSVVHDLTGFRVVNGLWVNAVVGMLLFLAVYLGGNRIHVRGGGAIAVLLLAGLPLLDESVDGYGGDSTNLFFLALLFLALSRYAERRDAAHLNWLLVIGLALSYSRNESVLYLLAVALLAGYLFIRERRSNLTVFTALSPLLLLPVLAARRVFQGINAQLSVTSPHLESEGFFSCDLIPQNFARVGDWLFDLSTTTPSYPVLSVLGVAGLVALFSALMGDLARGKSWKSVDGVLVIHVSVVLGSFIFVTLALFLNPVAGESVRVLLPLHLAFTYAVVWLLTRSNHAERLAMVIVVIAALGLFFMGIPKKMREFGGANSVFSNYADWSLDWLAEADDGKTLYLSQLHTLFLLYGYPSMDITRANGHISQIAQLEAEHYYGRIVIFVIEKFDPKTGLWTPPDPALPPSERFVSKLLAERRWAYNQRARFLELTGYRRDDGEVVAIEDLPTLRDQYPSFGAYREAMLRLHPGYVK